MCIIRLENVIMIGDDIMSGFKFKAFYINKSNIAHLFKVGGKYILVDKYSREFFISEVDFLKLTNENIAI